MPSPIVPTYRLTFPYVVNGFSHVFHKFLSVVASADPSGYNTVARAGHAAVGVSTVTPAVWTEIAHMYDPATATFGNAHLDQKIGIAWFPLWTEVNAVVPTGGGGNIPANDWVISGVSRVTRERYKMYLLESTHNPPNRFIAYPTGVTDINTILIHNFNTTAAATDADPWSWELTRNGENLGSWISAVNAFSKHWRRKRGLG